MEQRTQVNRSSRLPDKKPRNTGLKRIIAAVAGTVVFVFFLMLWNYVPALGGNEAAHCGTCHSMVPQYLTWQASNHSQFQCRECHREPGAASFIKYQKRSFYELVVYPLSDQVQLPPFGKVSSAACLNCHSENRKYSPFSDTIIPHSRHQAKGVECVDCHAGIAHGRIKARGVVKETPAEEWTATFAEEQMDYRYTTPRMAVCLDCHGKRQVTEKCSVCHSRQIVPASHKSANFERQHGQMAHQDFKPCNLCHSYSFDKSKDLLGLNVQGYIRNNTFCFNCHLQKPKSHKDSGFGQAHGKLSKERGIGNCMGCHDINKGDSRQAKPGNERPVNKVYCNKCHWFK